MRTLLMVVISVCALSALGCEDKKPEGAKPSGTGTAASPAKSAAPAHSAAPGGW